MYSEPILPPESLIVSSLEKVTWVHHVPVNPLICWELSCFDLKYRFNLFGLNRRFPDAPYTPAVWPGRWAGHATDHRASNVWDTWL